MSSQRSLQGKTILIVGGAGLIGKSIVDAAINAGANVVALDADERGLEALRSANENYTLLTIVVNLLDSASIENALHDAHDRFSGIDGAVNATYPRNAQYGRHFFEVQYADFCENTSMHMGGYFLFMQSCARYTLEMRKHFSLVNLSSIYGSMAPRFDIYADTGMTMPVEYSAIKAGIENMTLYINAYMKGRNSGFRANCVSPGGVFAGQNEIFVERYAKHCLDKGMLEPVDVAGAIIFLLSDASRYLAGQNLIVDDGFSI